MNKLSSSTHTIAATAACRGINHVLESEPWACSELAKHARKMILLQLPVGQLAFRITDAGRLEALKEIESPSLTLEVPAKALGDLLGGSGNVKEQAIKAVKISGDADLAQLIGRLAGQLRWEYEEDLARVFGDAPAHFAVQKGKKFISATKSAAGDLLDNLVEYVSEERKVLLNMRDFSIHKSELHELRDSIDRLEKRIQHLEQKGK